MGVKVRQKGSKRKRIVYRCLGKAGIRRVRFHDLRHTFASLSIAQNATPKKIQTLLGHHSIQVTMDIYGHLYAEVDQKVVAHWMTCLLSNEHNQTQPPRN